MKKPLFSLLYILSLLTAGLSIHQAFAQRSPSIEPLMEVSIEEERPVAKANQIESGFDFNKKAAIAPVETKRVPANITSKSKGGTPYSFIGPMIFLMALPIALWIVLSKKITNSGKAEKRFYAAKTFQFKQKNNYSEPEADEEDHHFPKAS